MPRTDRTFNLGRLSELQEQRDRLRVEIDALVKALIYHFDPMDTDCEYADRINVGRMKIYVNDIARKHQQLQKVLVEIIRLQEETGGLNGVT